MKGKMIKAAVLAAIVLFFFLTVAIMATVAAVVAGGASSKKIDLGQLMEGLPEILTEEMVVTSVEMQDNYGVPAALILAQIVLESSGTYPGNLSLLAYECNNFFGIKGVGPCGYKEYTTSEQTSAGASYEVTAKFKKYNNIRESILDHTDLLTSSRYKTYTAKAATTDEWAEAIWKAGYATDRKYPQKLINIMQQYNLYRFDGLTLDTLQSAGEGGDGIASGKLAWPLRFKGIITSTFGYRGDIGVAGASSNHGGIDIALGTGSPILAADGGTVVHAGVYGGGGNAVIISHSGGIKTHYYHMMNGGIMVSQGQKVSKGQQIGKVGSTGYSSGPHLHFGVEINGSLVDPLKYVKQPN